MLSFIENKLKKLHLLFFCTKKYGFLNALKMLLFVGSTSFIRTLFLKDENGKSLKFQFRGKKDLGVLSHFIKLGFRIEEVGGYKIKTILDCGANIGDETMRFALHHPSAEIISVEADPENYKILNSNFQDVSRVTAVNAAVWDSDTELYVFKNPNGNPESSWVSEKPSATPIKALQIQSLINLRGWKEIDILKLDVEGAEKQIFSGNTEWLKCVNCLIFEVPDSDAPGTTQLIFEKIKESHWNATAIGECLILIKSGAPLIAKTSIGIF
jgi:FkbM family methyltransferase